MAELDEVLRCLGAMRGERVAALRSRATVELADLRARLTTAKTERDELYVDCVDCREEVRRLTAIAHAAEARVEAAEQALGEIMDVAATIQYAQEVARRYFVARAALACPPQQRGE